MDAVRIGNFIKDLRKSNNLTQKQFADKLGVTYQAVSKWETGKSIPDIMLLKEISKIFTVDINELLEGEKKTLEEKNRTIVGGAKKRKWLLIGVVLVVVFLMILSIIYHKQDNDFYFKTMASSCNDFILTGSVAYNEDKTSIYISDVEYCGETNDTVYKEFTCYLYEDYQNTKTKISSCNGQDGAMKLEEFLDTIKINVNNYVASCKLFSSSSLYLEIQATDLTDQKISYEIPIRLEDNCKNID